MIAYSVVVLILWTSSIFVPLWFANFTKEDNYERSPDTSDAHFLRR